MDTNFEGMQTLGPFPQRGVGELIIPAFSVGGERRRHHLAGKVLKLPAPPPLRWADGRAIDASKLITIEKSKNMKASIQARIVAEIKMIQGVVALLLQTED